MTTMGAKVTHHKDKKKKSFSDTSCPQWYPTEQKAGVSNGREYNTCIYYPEALNNNPKLH